MKRCIACGAKLYNKPLMIINDMPSCAQNIPDEATLNTDHGITVSLCECSGCGLVQIDSMPVNYYRDVIRAGGYSTTMETLRKNQYEEWIELCDMTGKKIIEVGCGQGEFLKILDRYTVEAYGMEHKQELVDIARSEGLRVSCDYPDSEDAIFEDGPFDGFTSFNFLEHQPQPYQYLRAIANNLTEGASGLITVPSFEYIIEQDSFYEIIPDHIAYYTKDTLGELMNRSGFDVIANKRVNRDTLSMIVKKKKRTDVSGLIEMKDKIQAEVYSLIDKCKTDNKKIAIWGASHQGFTLCATTKLSDKVEYIIDSAPFKQGKYAPASHIKIVSLEYAKKNPVDVIIIVAPGYTDEITRIIHENFGGTTIIYTLMTNHLEKI